jgi:Raf kinase inhibitor-like YbhB/YbcL family protein
MELTSPDFRPGEMIPRQYTCDGNNTPPPLSWSGVPGNARSLALIIEDPDAPRGMFTHWIVCGLPPDHTQISESPRSGGGSTHGAVEGKNDFGRLGYGGPCPPPGPAHRYFFRLYALDQLLELSPGASRDQFLKAIQEHILAQAELMGRYARS